MKPLRKGKARSELAQGLAKLLETGLSNHVAPPLEGQPAGIWHISTSSGTELTELTVDTDKIAQLQAAVLGGAIEQALVDLRATTYPSEKEMLATFWRLTNENLWRLTRALEASGLLDKAGA